jgi:hypothetical protein
MSSTAVAEELKVKDAQRQGAKRATFAKLKAKKRAELEFTTKLPVGEGGFEEVSFLFRALSAVEFDRLTTVHPPSTEQKAMGANVNMKTFQPALLAKVCIDPVVTEEEWKELFAAPDWNQGELGELFWTAHQLCNRALDVNPIERGSE